MLSLSCDLASVTASLLFTNPPHVASWDSKVSSACTVQNLPEEVGHLFNKPGQSKILQAWMILLLNCQNKAQIVSFPQQRAVLLFTQFGTAFSPYILPCFSGVFVLDIFNESTVPFTCIVFLWHIFHNHIQHSVNGLQKTTYFDHCY